MKTCTNLYGLATYFPDSERCDRIIDKVLTFSADNFVVPKVRDVERAFKITPQESIFLNLLVDLHFHIVSVRLRLICECIPGTL